MGGQNTKEFKYSQPIGEKPEGSTRIYRNPNQLNELACFPSENITTMKDVFLNSVQKFPKNKLLGRRINGEGPFVWRTVEECKDIASALGSFLIRQNLTTKVAHEPYDMNLIGIFSVNREEWLLTEFSNFLYNHTMVPLYDTLGPDSIDYVLNQTEMTTIIASAKSVEILLKCQNPGKLANIVVMEELSPELLEKVQARGWKVFNFWNEVQNAQKEGNYETYADYKSECIFTFSYTSGTTGDPKGALISHKNIVSICHLSDIIETKYSDQDVYCSYLPLPHVLERLFTSIQLYQGGSIGMFSGNVQKLKDDLAELKPTIFASVPRLYNKFYDAIKSKLDAQTGVKGFLAKKGMDTKLSNQQKDNSVSSILWDTMLFNKTKNVLGGRVRIAATGGAPISAEVLTFLRVTLCMPLQEGYGSTETTGATFNTSIYDPQVGHVGGINPNMEFKLEDIAEMNYLSTDVDENGTPAPRGEICIRGNAIFAGYYKLPEKTAEAIDKDGWLHTGDVGLILPNGALKIIDRKKNLFKLSQGEYIAPEKIENIYVTSKWADEVFIHGDSLQTTLVTFVVPTKPRVEEWAQEKGVQFENYGELLKNVELRKEILKDLNGLGKQGGLHGFEQARNIHLVETPFQDLGITTNTFKIKRKDARDHFAKEIETLYSQPL